MINSDDYLKARKVLNKAINEDDFTTTDYEKPRLKKSTRKLGFDSDESDEIVNKGKNQILFSKLNLLVSNFTERPIKKKAIQETIDSLIMENQGKSMNILVVEGFNLFFLEAQREIILKDTSAESNLQVPPHIAMPMTSTALSMLWLSLFLEIKIAMYCYYRQIL